MWRCFDDHDVPRTRHKEVISKRSGVFQKAGPPSVRSEARFLKKFKTLFSAHCFDSKEHAVSKSSHPLPCPQRRFSSNAVTVPAHRTAQLFLALQALQAPQALHFFLAKRKVRKSSVVSAVARMRMGVCFGTVPFLRFFMCIRSPQLCPS